MLNLLYPLARAILFRMDAEKAHHLSMAGLRRTEKIGLLKALADKPVEKPVSICGLDFPNPVGLAAGLLYLTYKDTDLNELKEMLLQANGFWLLMNGVFLLLLAFRCTRTPHMSRFTSSG